MIEIRIEIHVCNAFVHAALCSFFHLGRVGGVAIMIIILFEVSFACFLPYFTMNASPVLE